MYESGARQPSVRMLEDLTEIFGVDVNFLLGWKFPQSDLGLDEEYLRFAKEMRDKMVKPSDVRAAIAILEMARSQRE